MNPPAARAQRLSAATLIGSTSLLVLSACVSAPPPKLSEVGVYSAAQGSGFLPYAQGLAAYLSANCFF
jgi:hypothetical protein